ncbi:MAG: PhoH family protein [Desulfonauticus sp.]|nr:PhoH family protein [Desulfonauticus sp.]
MNKKYILDTNVLLDNPESILILRNGQENEVYIPYSVICELDKLKAKSRLQAIISQISHLFMEHREWLQVLRLQNVDYSQDVYADELIIEEILAHDLSEPILVTNDVLLQFKAEKRGISTQEFKSSKPYQSVSEMWTGISEPDDIVPNSFVWENGKPVYHKVDSVKVIDYQHKVWGIVPKNIYQNLAFELLLDNTLDIVTLQSKAGYGKTILSLAAAFHLVLQEKDSPYKKIFILKPCIEIGKELGFRPGSVDDKMEPIIRPIKDLIEKLHEIRPANKLFKEDGEKFNPKKLEILPLNFVRGMNIENAILLIDEGQNLSRNEMRAVLTRCGENTRVFICGDTNQVDNPYLNEDNNGLNWVTKLCKGQPNYGHLVLTGPRSRGPITDLILRVGL